MNDRLLKLRKTLGLSQEIMGRRLGVTRSSISNMETGRFGITDTMIKLVCSEFGASETWLRTGEGEMFPDVDREQRISAELSRLLNSENNSVKKQLIDVWLQLSEDDCEVFLKFAEMLLKNQENK